MKVLIIGNGFDIAHGLPTKYIDFLDFIKQFNLVYEINERSVDFLVRSGNYIPFLIDLFRSWDSNSSKFIQEFKKASEANIWIEHFLSVMSFKGQNWIDFEKEIYEVVTKLETVFESQSEVSGWQKKIDSIAENMNNYSVFQADIKAKAENCKEFRQDSFEKLIIDDYVSQLENLTRAFEIYLTFYVAARPVNGINQDILDLNLGKEDAIISFNYIDTYNRVYDSNKVDKVHFVHGSAKLDNTIYNNNMVLGIDEKRVDQSKENLKYVRFRKYFQRIVKGTDASYKKIFAQGNESEQVEVYFFGHSLDSTDRDILKEILLSERTKVVIFSIDKEAQKQHVNNLISILGSKEVVANVYDFDPKIKFVLQSQNGTTK